MSDEQPPVDPTADQPPGPEDDLEIETIGVWETTLEEAIDPHHDPALAAVGCGQPGGVPRVFLRADALEQVLDHAASDTSREVGGVLLGSFYTSRGRLTTDVREVLAAPETRAGVSHVTFSHDTWAAIFRQVDPTPTRAIVGWYHSHPGFGVFLSQQDLFIQENFFDGDGYAALVIDPLKHEIGVFARREGRVVPHEGFWIAAAVERREKADRYAGLLHYKITRGKPSTPGLLDRLLGRRP